MERSAESAEQSRAASMSQDMSVRESAQSLPRSLDHSRHPSLTTTNTQPDRLSNDVWTSAISRLQAQVSYNTGMLESHRRQFADMESAVTRLHQDLGNMLGMLNEVRAEMRSRPNAPPAPEPARHDPTDLDILTSQLHRLTNKVNEIDGIGLQVEMMKNRMKRMEDGGSVPPPNHRPAASSHKEPSAPDALSPPLPAAPASQGRPIPHHPAQHQQLAPAHHPPLPPMRTASMASPDVNRPPSYPAQHVLESQNAHSHRSSAESRPYPGERNAVPQPPPGPGFHPADALPPPSTISGWRPAESGSPAGVSAASAHPPARPHVMDHDSRGAQQSGWAAVNTNGAIKRPPEDARSPYESPLDENSKRPKLAPLMPNMPRPVYADDGHGPPQPPFPSSGVSMPSDPLQHPGSRAPPDGSQPQPHPTPASTLQHSFRFITSTQQADASELWRQDSHHDGPHQPHTHGRGGRGGRGRGRGRGGRGRGGGGGGHPGGGHHHVGHHHGGHHGGHHNGHPEQQEHGTPEWERPEYAGSQGSPNGYGHPLQSHLQSPNSVTRGGIVRRGDAHMGIPLERQHHEFPATPIQGPLGDPYAGIPDGTQGSSGKKTRTKPVRNQDGILIRKDGRPDMRSVSSANNLRKVHAKKEAERGGMDDDEVDGLTRSGTPASASAADDRDASAEAADNAHARKHHEIMNKILGRGPESESRASVTQLSPRPDDPAPAPAAPQIQMKVEDTRRDSDPERKSTEPPAYAPPPPPADVVMKDSGDAASQAEDRHAHAAAVQQQDVTNNAAAPVAAAIATVAGPPAGPPVGEQSVAA